MIEPSRAHHSRFRRSTVLAMVLIAGCGGTTPTTTTAAVTTSPPTTVAESTTTVTTAIPETTTTTMESVTIGILFLQIVEDPGPGDVDISYPHLVHPDSAIANRVNAQIDSAIRDLIEDFQEGVAADTTSETASTLVVQAAPELLNDAVISVSGITSDFYAGSDTGSTGRLGMVFALDNGAQLSAGDLFIGGDLERLAESAREHLIADVLGDESLLIAPDGLLPDAANFDAVWLTSTGVGVGFDQFQVAAADAGNPAVLIPFAELRDVINAVGILEPLESGSTLPEGP